jgi:hypothetical protein
MSFSGDRCGQNVLRPKIGRLDAFKGFQPALYCKTELHIHTGRRGNAISMIISEPRKQIDAAIASILIGAMVVVGFVALIFVTLGEGSHGPDAVTWRAAVSLVLVGCLIAGLINAIQVFAQIRRRNLEAKRITMASWLGLPSSADAGRSASPSGTPTDC